MANSDIRIRIDVGYIVRDNPRWMFLRAGSCGTIQNVITKIAIDYNLQKSYQNIKLYLNGAILPPNESVSILQSDDLVKVLIDETNLPETEEGLIIRTDQSPSYNTYPTPVSSLAKCPEPDTGSQVSQLFPIVPVPSRSNSCNTEKLNNLHVTDEIEIANKICTSLKKLCNSENSSFVDNDSKIEAFKNSKHKTILLSRLRNPGSKTSCSTMFSNVSDNFNDRFSKLSHSQISEMLALEEARKQSAANIRIKLGEFGEPWMKGWKYSECCIMFECGTPDMMWLYAQSPGLSMVNSFVQVRVHNYFLYISTRQERFNQSYQYIFIKTDFYRYFLFRKCCLTFYIDIIQYNMIRTNWQTIE